MAVGIGAMRAMMSAVGRNSAAHCAAGPFVSAEYASLFRPTLGYQTCGTSR